jgi:CRISPR/Cas system-associated protein Cas5 (RAMP superfamily)
MCMYKKINIFREPENLRLTAIAAHAKNLYNKIEKIAELNRKTVYFYSPKHLEVEILQISRVHDLYK